MNRMLIGALALLSMFSPSLWQTVKNIPVIASPCPYVQVAIACAHGNVFRQQIYYSPITSKNPDMTDSGELFLLLVKEGTHVQQMQMGLTNTPSTCMDMETAGQTAMGQAWSWLWYDNPPRNVAYGPVEDLAIQDVTDPTMYARLACTATFTPWEL